MSECDREASIMRRPRPPKGLSSHWKKSTSVSELVVKLLNLSAGLVFEPEVSTATLVIINNRFWKEAMSPTGV